MDNYEDIISMEHHISKVHKPMKMENRAAQFSPFAALTGYGDTIKEAARITDSKKYIDENMKSILDNKLNIIRNNIKNKPYITITYFKKDNNKTGGKYLTISGNVQKIDNYNCKIIINNIGILINDILDIDI